MADPIYHDPDDALADSAAGGGAYPPLKQDLRETIAYLFAQLATSTTFNRELITAATYTFAEAKTGYLHVFSNASGCAATVPEGIDPTCYFIILNATDSGVLTIAGGDSATITSKLGHSSVSAGPCAARLVAESADVWMLDGDTE